jgi:primosomal protein N'
MGGHVDRGRIGVKVLNHPELVDAVRVVPAVPTFAVDGGFWYLAPEHLDLGLGSMVRVPLGGRRVRGFVVETARRPPQGLKAVVARSGNLPVFDRRLLESLEWASKHYVAPLSVMLERATPPNNPTRLTSEVIIPTPGGGVTPLAEVAAAAASGRRRRPTVWIGPNVDASWLAALAAPVLASGKSVMVIGATATEIEHLAIGLEALGPVVVSGDRQDRSITDAWRRAQTSPVLLMGTPRVAAWSVGGLALTILIGDGRRAMKDRQTPGVHARDLIRARSIREGFALVVAGPTPSVEAIGWGADIHRAPGRAWPLVEVIDRRDDPPGSGLFAEPAKRAVQAVVAAGGSVFLFAHRRGYAAATRCISCRQLRLCPGCGARQVGAPACERCGVAAGPCPGCGGNRFEPLGAGVGRLVDEASRLVGSDRVAPYPAQRPVLAGTERDLADLEMQDLVVMVDLDGLLFGSNYRAAEEALRVGARLAGRVRRGRRLIVQTHEPGHPVVAALRAGDPTPFLDTEVAARSAFGYPPSGELLVLETRGSHDPESTDHELRRLATPALVMGPAETKDGRRWLIQGPRLDDFKTSMRPVLQRLRDSGVTVRVDADPIDL